MNTIFYITSPLDVNFATILSKEYHKLISENKIYYFTHTLLIKDKLKSNGIPTNVIFSESEILFSKNNKYLNYYELFYIKYIENHTNCNLWKFVYQDRWLSMKRRGVLYKEGTKYKRNVLLRTILNKFKIIELILRHYKIDKLIYVSQDVGTSSASIIYETAKYLNIKIVCPAIAKFGNYFFLNNTIYSEIKILENVYSKLSSKNINDIPAKFLNLYNQITKEKLPVYEVPKNKNLKLMVINNIILLIKYYKHKYYKDPKQKSPFLVIYDKILSRINSIIISNTFKYDDIKVIEKYIYFPLHLEPELTLLLYAEYYSDQLTIIRNIAKSLPGDICLVVKDHPLAIGRRNISFYRKIKKIPNVKIINPKTPNQKVIKNSLAVTTITGTSGIEAFYLRKPVITFGNVFYNFLEKVVNVKNFEMLPTLWNKLELLKPEENEVYKYIYALYKTAYEINILQIINDTSQLNSKSIFNYNDENIVKYAKFLSTI